MSGFTRGIYKFYRSFGSQPNLNPAAGRVYSGDEIMPSLLRFLSVIGIIGAIGYGGVFALAYFVKPTPREISVTLPADRFYKQR